MADYQVVDHISEVPEETNKCFDINGHKILICHHKGQIFAVRNECPHARLPLEGGKMRRGALLCPAHGAQFELQTGRHLCPPAYEPVESFPVKVENDVIYVLLD